MSASLTGIARDVVAGFLFSEKPPLTLRFSLSRKDDFQAVRLFYGQYSTLSNRLFFFPFAVCPKRFFDKQRVYIHFFYRGRGLYLAGPLERVKNGFAFIVPQIIFKSAHIPPVYLKDISAKIYVSGFTSVQAECRLKSGYAPFNNKLWLCFSKEEALSAKKIFETQALFKIVELPPLCRKLIARVKRILYLPGKKIPERNFFPFSVSITTDDLSADEKNLIGTEVHTLEYDAYIPLSQSLVQPVHTILAFKSYKPMASPVDVEEKLFLLPVCRFLSDVHKNTEAVWGRQPLSILCLTHSLIILGGSGFSNKTDFKGVSGNLAAPFPLTEGSDYLMRIKILLGPVCRLLKTSINVAKIYKNNAGFICAMCFFSQMQEEDRRFLYEKFYGILYK